MRARTSAQTAPTWLISTSLTGGPTAWLSSAAPIGRITPPSTGSSKIWLARPSQNSLFE